MREHHITSAPVSKAKMEKGKKKKFCLRLSLHLEDNKAVQYHIKWAGEDGCSHSLSNKNRRRSENQEEEV